ncbi:MAG: HAMP domain-containing protein [Bacteroidales bacterium]|nr:HAMP domain-containing protein [Candidatus Physcocola equi]
MKKYLIAFLSSLLVCFLANWAYFKFPVNAVDYERFEQHLHARESFARDYVMQVKNKLETIGCQKLSKEDKIYEDSDKNGMSVFVFQGDSIAFWSSNSIDIRSVDEIPNDDDVFFAPTRNSYCLGVQTKTKYDERCVVFIKIKHNRKLTVTPVPNSFLPGFNLPQSVRFVDENMKDARRVCSIDGKYLFSLYSETSAYEHFNWLLYLTIFAAVFAFAVMVFAFVRWVSMAAAGKGSRFHVLIGMSVALLLIFVFVYVRWPAALFSCSFFSPNLYASDLCPSLGHLVILTALIVFFIWGIQRLRFPLDSFVENGSFSKSFVLMGQLLGSLFFVAACALAHNLVENSVMDVATPYVQDISLATVVGLFLVMIWFTVCFLFSDMMSSAYSKDKSLWIVLGCRAVVTFIVISVIHLLHLKIFWMPILICAFACVLIDVYHVLARKRTLLYCALLAFVGINLTVSVCYTLCESRNNDRFLTLVENMVDNHTLLHDEDDERIMHQIAPVIQSDTLLKSFLALPDSVEGKFEEVEKYLLDKYLDGFGNKYDLDIQIVKTGRSFLVRKSHSSDPIKVYPSFFSFTATPVVDRCFYLSTRVDWPLSYVGVFPFGEQTVYVFFYPSLSYSRKTVDNNISIVKYHDDEILYMTGDYHYPSTSSWIPAVKDRLFRIHSSDYAHSIARFDGNNGFIIVSRPEYEGYTYFIFVSYFCALITLIALIVTFFYWLSKRKSLHHSILRRMQIWFLVPMLISFFVIGVFSVMFFMEQYKQKMVRDMATQAITVEKKLQQQIGFSSMDKVDSKRLFKDIKDLSSLFHVEILVFNNHGGQVTSSLSTSLTANSRTQRLMYPKPFFSSKGDYFRESTYDENKSLFSYYTYLYNGYNQKVGYVAVHSPVRAQQLGNEVFNLLVVIIDLYLVIILLTVLVTWYISNRLTQPVTMLSLQMKEVKLTGKNNRIDYDDDDEIGSLVLQYNAMVDQLQFSAEQLAQSQRELAWRDMARRIAHEIKNPLTPMKLSVQMAQRKMEVDPDGFPEYFKRTSSLLIEQIDNLSQIASSFSTFAKSTVTVREEVDLAAKVQSAVDLFRNNPEMVRFELNMNGIESALVWSDNKQILQVFNNLFKNAIQAIPDDRDGVVKIDFSLRQDPDKGEVARIAVSDNGCGIPKDNLHTIFEPNFTTKTSGMGLGLSIVKTIVNLANGDISVSSEVGVGTTFYITIPLIAK